MVPIFTLLGLILPWQEWIKLGWEGLTLAFLILLLHRLPIIFLIKSFIPDIKDNLDASFIGWFGPVGIGAFYYSQISMKETGIIEIWPIVSLIICASVILHGITSTPFIKIYGKHNTERSEDQKKEPKQKESKHK